jgi:periplasmic protein TonB
MSDAPHNNQQHLNKSAGHLSVSIDGAHVDDIQFSFDREPKRLSASIIASAIIDVAVVALLVVASRYHPNVVAEAQLPEQPNKNIIWLAEPGPGGGGGGGGNRMKEPPRQAEMPGKDKITVPVAPKPPAFEPPKPVTKEPNPIEQLNIPAKELAAAENQLPGQIEAPPGPPTLSQGSGSGGGAGTGTGTGIGPGTGSGLGPGSGGGTGGGVYQPGSGVTNPIPIRQPSPSYTSDAMRAKVQGVAVVGCVIEVDGRPSQCHIVRSLDSTFGLDLEAMKAAQNWRFRPGMAKGEPVRVAITIEMSFTLR